MTGGDEAFNPYEPPRAEVGPGPRAASAVARPRWVRVALGGSKLPGLSARRSALAWFGFAGLVGLLGMTGGIVFGATISWESGLEFGLLAGGTELAAAGWLHQAIGWVDRHEGW